MLVIRHVGPALLLAVLTELAALQQSSAALKQASGKVSSNTATRQYGGQNFGNALGPSGAGFPGAGGFGGAGFGGAGYPGAGAGFGGQPGAGAGGGGGGYPGCPLCDASVYSYCSHKMIHDACCCDFSGPQLQQQKPPQCLYYDCSLLYAKSCYEHSLIKNCCCNNPY